MRGGGGGAISLTTAGPPAHVFGCCYTLCPTTLGLAPRTRSVPGSPRAAPRSTLRASLLSDSVSRDQGAHMSHMYMYMCSRFAC